MVIAFTNTEGSPLTEYGTFNIKYEFGADVRAELTKMGTVLRVAFELLSELDSYDHYSLAVEGFQRSMISLLRHEQKLYLEPRPLPKNT